MDYRTGWKLMRLGIYVFIPLLLLGIATGRYWIAVVGAAIALAGVIQSAFFFKCPHCGKTINTKDIPKHCPECGKALGE